MSEQKIYRDVVFQAADNVGNYLVERDGMEGLHADDIHLANLYPLRVSDLKILIEAARRLAGQEVAWANINATLAGHRKADRDV